MISTAIKGGTHFGACSMRKTEFSHRIADVYVYFIHCEPSVPSIHCQSCWILDVGCWMLGIYKARKMGGIEQSVTMTDNLPPHHFTVRRLSPKRAERKRAESAT